MHLPPLPNAKVEQQKGIVDLSWFAWWAKKNVTPTTIVNSSPRLAWNNVQCWMVSNDYWKKATGKSLWLWDSYNSKIAAIDKVWTSPTPAPWGVFVMNTGTWTGHTWVVQSVDLANGTFTVVDANAKWSTTWWPVRTATYKITDRYTFSNPPNIS